MDNLKSPAYPLDFPLRDYPKAELGFTKLEMASLMIAQGMMQPRLKLNDILNAGIIFKSVEIARAVLEEANK